MAFSPDGTQIVTGTLGGANLWGAGNDTPQHLLDSAGSKSVAFAPDGTRIFTGSPAGAKVWDARTGVQLIEFGESVVSAAFAPDGTRIVTGSSEGAEVWDASNGTQFFDPQGDSGEVTSVAFSPDGMRIVTGNEGRTAKVWDARTGVQLIEFGESVESAAFSPDGTRIVTSGWGGATVWDARIGAPLVVDLKGPTSRVDTVAFSPDGTRIVTCSSQKQTPKVWDTRTGSRLFDLVGHSSIVNSVAFSTDGTQIVTGGVDGTAKVWDAETGDMLLDVKAHTLGVEGVAFSPDGMQIVTGCQDKTANVWDAQTGSLLCVLQGHSASVTSVAFSPDGTQIVIGGGNATAKVWDTRTGKEFPGISTETLSKNSFSPDGRLFAHVDDERVSLIPLELDREQLAYRLVHTRPSVLRYLEGLYTARGSNDEYAETFYLERILSLPDQRTTARFQERNEQVDNPLAVARTGFHRAALAMTPYDRAAVDKLAESGNRLAKRLMAQEYLREGKPKLAIPLLTEVLQERPDHAPPVEQLLLAQAHLALIELEEAKRFHQAAVDWLDKPHEPGPATEVIAQLKTLFEVPKPLDDPRYNPFDWESWHESDVFRAEVEKALQAAISKPAAAE